MPENSSHIQPDDLNTEFLRVSHELAEKKVEEELLVHPNLLLPKQALLTRYETELQAEFTQNRKRQENGALKIAEALEELAKENPNLLTDEVVNGIDRIANLSETLAKDLNHFTKLMEEGKTLQDLAQVDDTVIETLYQAAKYVYERRLFDDAADAFLYLTGLNPNRYVFWLGLGNAEYHRNQFKQALRAYTVVCEITPRDPSCLLTKSRCHEALGDLQSALNVLDEAVAVLTDGSSTALWKTQLEQEKERLKQLQHH